MKFEQALAAMRDGKKVRHHVWEKGCYIKMENMHIVTEDGSVWEPPSAIFADTWEIYEEPKWEPIGGPWAVNTTGTVEYWNSNGRRFFGCERKTKEQAEKAAKKMRTFNRLLAYVDEHAPDYEADWSKNGKNYFVCFDHDIKKWKVEYDLQEEDAAQVYMPKEVAIKLADDLNSGRVELSRKKAKMNELNEKLSKLAEF